MALSGRLIKMTSPLKAAKPKLVLRIKDPKRFFAKTPEQVPCLTDEEYQFLLDDIEKR
jgi:hypothetical protein